MKRIIYSLALFSCFCLFACKKNNSKRDCTQLAIVPYQPFKDPVWHPNGQLLGFNHTPQTGIFPMDSPPCEWFMNAVNRDSTGFYLMNKDGTGFKRVTNYYLYYPSWSPDGSWLAFCAPPHIYKMRFDGVNFDTANIVQLTTTDANFHPSWTLEGDAIYYDSNRDTPSGSSFYSVWKMTDEGNEKARVTQSEGIGDTRQPFIGSDNRVYYTGYIDGISEIFSMKKDGTDKRQETFNGKSSKRTPVYYENKVFFWDAAIFSSPTTIYSPKQLTNFAGESYTISINGEVVYLTMEFSITDKRCGTLWIMNADGSNKRQLTFNNF